MYRWCMYRWLWSYSLEQSKEESQETTESLIGGEEVVDNDLISTSYDVFRFRNWEIRNFRLDFP